MQAAADTAFSIRGFLHRPALDLFIIAGPWLIFGGLLASGISKFSDTNQAVWVSQFILGNTTHVVLTFLLLGFRRDILFATRGQAKVVLIGSAVTFALTLLLVQWVARGAPFWTGFPLAIIGIFGTHHRLSQAKGIWALYNLRGSTLGMPAPHPLERTLSKHWASVGLIAVMTAWLFTPSGPNRMFPFLQAIPNEPAFLPYAVNYGLALGWAGFVLLTLFTMARAPERNLPKMLHIGSHGVAVALAILLPAWGAVVWGSIHGLEYYFLCARMMKGRPGDSFAGPNSWAGQPALVWLLIIVSMLPLFWVGLGRAPFSIEFGSRSGASDAIVLVNALVVAHYFADAFIYRFRIPEVRRVALNRLGFAQSTN